MARLNDGALPTQSLISTTVQQQRELRQAAELAFFQRPWKRGIIFNLLMGQKSRTTNH